jgi:hypothetical protein
LKADLDRHANQCIVIDYKNARHQRMSLTARIKGLGMQSNRT